ncbi:hypothetical protein KFE25_011713 [Diacronema lutheri]|uniref:Uncharacterized protein n=1 Tax=Diacronema lutheri TaxID=2081491 RepID=A0A8J6C0T9_DIALT|nr:hypothetical protein KFE25_011713 [Diacronema lutheri]
MAPRAAALIWSAALFGCALRACALHVARSGAVRRASERLGVRARARMAGPRQPARFATVEALEAELRAHVAALPAAELDDESLPPPLAYSELSRNGRDDLARAVMDAGGYIQMSRRLGLRWALPKKAAPPPVVEVRNFDPREALKSGFLKLGEARSATEDVLETKRLSEFARREPAQLTPQQVGRSKLAELLRPARAPYVSTDDPLPGRQLLVDMQMSLPQRASAVLLAWALALAFGAHPTVPLDGDALLAARGAAVGLAAAHAALGAYAAVLAAGKGRSAVTWALKAALAGAPALAELRDERTRLRPPTPPPGDAGGGSGGGRASSPPTVG